MKNVLGVDLTGGSSSNGFLGSGLFVILGVERGDTRQCRKRQFLTRIRPPCVLMYVVLPMRANFCDSTVDIPQFCLRILYNYSTLEQM